MIQELQKAIQSVVDAGLSIESIYNTDFSVEMKSKDDPVTEADLSAHRIIRQRLIESYPDDALLSEEDLSLFPNRLTIDRVWILDPIDGTRDFVEKNPEFAVSLGLSVGNKAVLGVVYNPITKELFWGAQGVGYGNGSYNGENIDDFLNNTNRLNITLNTSSRDKILIYVSNTEKKHNLYKELESLPGFQDTYTIQSVGSIAYKLGLLHSGKADLVVSLKPKNEWDICGGIAILDLAGFETFSILNPRPYSFNNEDTKTYGLLAGRKELVQKFWEDHKNFLQISLRKWDGTRL